MPSMCACESERENIYDKRENIYDEEACHQELKKWVGDEA